LLVPKTATVPPLVIFVPKPLAALERILRHGRDDRPAELGTCGGSGTCPGYCS
jgi:hypothetical protein